MPPLFSEMRRFAAVGTVNFLVDFAVLNALMLLTGLSYGIWFSAEKAVAYCVANANSYFMNRTWTFRRDAGGSKAEYGRFFLFSLAGIGVNVGVSSLIMGAFAKPEAFSAPLWANCASVAGAAALMLWNFFTYRTYVFRSR